MSADGRLAGGIIAAGEGRRLREDGWPMPKPLVTIAGVPLMASVVGNFAAAGIPSIVAIVNEAERECVEWARGRFPGVDLRFIVKTTASSLESFLEVVRAPSAAGPGPILVSTVDAWCPPADFSRFVEAARRRPAGSTVLAVTPFVADESPLWAQLGPDGRIAEIGGSGGDVVTAGIYLVPERVRRLTPPPGLGRLREFLGWLVQSGEPVYGDVIPKVIDVDRSSDVALAEALAARMDGAHAGHGVDAARPRSDELAVAGAKMVGRGGGAATLPPAWPSHKTGGTGE